MSETKLETEIPYSEFVNTLVKPGRDIIDELEPGTANLLHMGLGVGGEAPELLGAILWMVMDGKQLDRKNAVEELGDMEFFLEGLRAELRIKREETLQVRNMHEDFTGITGAWESIAKPLAPAVRLVVAAGELMDLVKKGTIYGMINMPSRAHFLKALGVVEFYMERLRVALNISWEETIAANREKLGLRFEKKKFDNAQAGARKDKNPGQNSHHEEHEGHEDPEKKAGSRGEEIQGQVGERPDGAAEGVAVGTFLGVDPGNQVQDGASIVKMEGGKIESVEPVNKAEDHKHLNAAGLEPAPVAATRAAITKQTRASK